MQLLPLSYIYDVSACDKREKNWHGTASRDMMSMLLLLSMAISAPSSVSTVFWLASSHRLQGRHQLPTVESSC
jgi:hypothetical protein